LYNRSKLAQDEFKGKLLACFKRVHDRVAGGRPGSNRCGLIAEDARFPLKDE
jgi:hypothetical protein